MTAHRPSPVAGGLVDPPRLGAWRGRHLVVTNWRDGAHPFAGGAELYCESVAERFVRAGAQVTLLTSRPPGAPASELARGVRVRRMGGTATVYPRVLAWLAAHRREVDAVLDCQNGIPFFAPLVVERRTPVVCLVHHVHQEQFRQYFPWPVSVLGRALESRASRLVYRDRPLVAVSPSTRSQVRTELRLRGPIHLVPNGADAGPGPGTADPSRPRRAAPSITCVGRLVPHKRLGLLLDALPALRELAPGLRVDIAGDGPERPDLQRQASAKGLDDIVTFHGRVSDVQRRSLLRSAWLTVNPSVGEGWGLSVLEANAQGVPAVAFRVPGLRDAVRHGETGWLVEEGSALAPVLAQALAQLADPAVAAVMSAQARVWAGCFSWDETAGRVATVLSVEEDRLALLSGRTEPVSLRRERRRSTDLAVRVRLSPGAGDLSLLRSLFRRTDVLSESPTALALVLHAADEHDVLRRLRRLGLRGQVEVEVARPLDLLVPHQVAAGAGTATVALQVLDGGLREAPAPPADLP